MDPIAGRLVETALGEWAFFGRSTRGLDDAWRLAGDQADEPYRSRVGAYWAAVGRPGLDGGSDEPWSAAFVSWCFAAAGAGAAFAGHDTHSVYVDRIRRHAGMSAKLDLHPPREAPLAPGDLIWNSRWESADEEARAPKSFEEAMAELAAGNFFPSHVDIVVAVGAASCDSVGGNVSNRDPGGSVTRSTWRLAADGTIADPRKVWIGVVKNGL
ncbi:MAG TPA: DUF2272 domain-containing protein [Allosphingosinicella sp.]|nr:DUF2272 domain-containing protein [Allosphingosinicella sp.]